MNLHDWLEGGEGRHKSLASHFGITPSAVSQWLTNGVPIDRMAEIVAFSKGEVSLESMVLASIAAKRDRETAQ
jgi:DNA-binding transcriptional regulator YdaS (Cro superfamily)